MKFASRGPVRQIAISYMPPENGAGGEHFELAGIDTDRQIRLQCADSLRITVVIGSADAVWFFDWIDMRPRLIEEIYTFDHLSGARLENMVSLIRCDSG